MTIPRPRIAVLPDSTDARLLAELTSHASDLSEASHTLALGFAAGEGSDLWGPLTSHAVTAYIRPFIHSNVRARLDEMPGIPPVPPALKPVHDTIRTYRNRTVAHSQSALATPLAVAILDASGRPVDVIGLSITHPMPLVLAEHFSGLISAMEDVVDQATRPVQDRLRTWLKEETPESINGWEQPETIHAIDSDFTAASTRNPASRFTAYWRIEHGTADEQSPDLSFPEPGN